MFYIILKFLNNFLPSSLIISCLIVFCPNIYAETNSCKNHQCIVVIDAGSTGTRLHIYAYDLDETLSPIHISEIWSKKNKPGFATIDPSQSTVNTYLNQLFADAPEKQLPVYFYATAGMRLLSTSKQKNLYEEVQNWFAKQNQWKLTDAKTITGYEEALYGWLSVNYHLNTLKHFSKNKSIGVMDMGGASVQIVFPMQKTEKVTNDEEVMLHLYGQEIKLSVHSFLGLGLNEMSHQFLNSVSCFSNNYRLPDGKSAQGNALSCEQEVSSLMNAVHGVNASVQPLIGENPVDSWYAMGGIANLAESKLFHFNNNQLTLQSLLEQANDLVCQQQWDILNNEFPNDDYIHQYCLISAYYYALMVNGYGLNPEKNIHYLPPEQNIDWTTGVVLHH